MTCPACATRIEKSPGPLGGVVATVNFATEKATVMAPASVPVRRLTERIEQAGYGAEVAAPADGGGPDAARVAYLRRRPGPRLAPAAAARPPEEVASCQE